MHQSKGEKSSSLALFLVLAIGVALRLGTYIGDDSPWRDEAKLFMSLLETSFSDLDHPLPGDQKCPLLLAFLLKALIEAGFTTSASIRLPSLLAGIILLLVMYRILTSLGEPDERPTGTLPLLALVCVAPHLLIFCNQAKPYAFDILCSAVILLLSLRILSEEGPAARPALWGTLCWIALLVSYSAVFVVASTLLAIAYKRGRRGLVTGLVISLGCLLIIGATYPLGSEKSEYMRRFWADGFATAQASWWMKAAAQTFFYWMASPNLLSVRWLTLLLGWIFGPLFLLGMVGLKKRNQWAEFMVLMTPVALSLVASAFEKYPYRDRLLVFLFPQILTLVALGLRELRSGSVLRSATSRYISLVAVGIGIVSAAELMAPCPGTLEGLQIIRLRGGSGDVVLVDLLASQVVRYQLWAWKQKGIEPAMVFRYEWLDETNQQGRPNPDEVVSKLPGHSRVWFLAEPQGYQRYLAGDISNSARGLIQSLEKRRSPLLRVAVPRLFVGCFSAQLSDVSTSTGRASGERF